MSIGSGMAWVSGALVMALAVLACGESENKCGGRAASCSGGAASAHSGGTVTSAGKGGGSNNSAGSNSDGGSLPLGGGSGGGSPPLGGAAGADGEAGSGGSADVSCLDGLEGVWALPGYPAYLQIDGNCQVTLFCDLDKGYHTTGHVRGDVLTLTEIATLSITLEGDDLTLLQATNGMDLLFERQASTAAIPEACYP